MYNYSLLFLGYAALKGGFVLLYCIRSFQSFLSKPKMGSVPTGASSKLFEPLKIADGKIELKHRIILAPLTRNRCLPLQDDTPKQVNRIWYPDELVAKYYEQRATEGGLLISEGLPPSLEVS